MPLNEDAVFGTQHLPLVTLRAWERTATLRPFSLMCLSEISCLMPDQSASASVTTGSSPHPRFTLTMARFARAEAQVTHFW